MARPPLELSFADLDVLSRLLQEQPRSMLSASQQVGVQRTRLLRLAERANRLVDRDAPWRGSTGVTPPPELRRLVQAYERFRAELERSVSSPVVSSGPSAATLLAKVAAEAGISLSRAAFLRSDKAVEALQHDEIDIAMLHGSSLQRVLDGRALPEGLTCRHLLAWRPVRVRSAATGARRARLRIAWEPNSLGDRLAKADPQPKTEGATGPLTWPCDSFLLALDLLRRGVVAEVVVPDIYLPRADPGLEVEPMPQAGPDELVALYRQADDADWADLLDPPRWQALRAEG